MRRDRQILDAAAALFYDKGFDGVGVDEIGARAGVSGPAIYHHFSGKNEILERLFTEALDELLGATEPDAELGTDAASAEPTTDPQADLDRLVRRHVEFAVAKRHLVNVFQRESRSLATPGRDGLQRRMRQYASRWEEALAGCYPAANLGDRRGGAQAAIGLIHSVAYWPAGALEADDLVGLLCRLVTGGLASLDRPDGRPQSTGVTGGSTRRSSAGSQ